MLSGIAQKTGETVKTIDGLMMIDGSRAIASNRKAWKGKKAFYLQREASSCSSTFFFVCPTYSPVRFRPEVSARGNAETAKHQTLRKKTNQSHSNSITREGMSPST